METPADQTVSTCLVFAGPFRSESAFEISRVNLGLRVI